MPRYLFQGTYSREGAQGLLSEGGTRRRDAVAHLVQSLGGTLEGFHYALGDTDLFMIVELPGNIPAAAASLIVAASGAGHWKTTVLLSAEEMDAAAWMETDYRAPGGQA